MGGKRTLVDPTVQRMSTAAVYTEFKCAGSRVVPSRHKGHGDEHMKVVLGQYTVRGRTP